MTTKESKEIKTTVSPPLPVKLTLPNDSHKRIKLSDISCQCKKKKTSDKFDLQDKSGGKKKRRTKRYKKSKKISRKQYKKSKK